MRIESYLAFHAEVVSSDILNLHYINAKSIVGLPWEHSYPYDHRNFLKGIRLFLERPQHYNVEPAFVWVNRRGILEQVLALHCNRDFGIYDPYARQARHSMTTISSGDLFQIGQDEAVVKQSAMEFMQYYHEMFNKISTPCIMIHLPR